MKRTTYFRALLFLCFFASSHLLSAQINLELNMSATPLAPEAFKNFTFSISISNTSASTATGVSVDIPLTAGFTFQGGNEYTASQGTYDFYVSRVWIVGNLAPGASATIELNLYSLQSSQLYLYAEVSSADQSDLDSTPANGGCPGPDPSGCAVNEDDEALIVLSNSGTCALDVINITTTCYDPNNTPDPFDDTWSFSFEVVATDAPSNGWITFSQGYNGATGSYGQIESLGNFFISNGPIEITLFDQQNNACFTTFTVSPPPPCSNSNCSLQASTSTAICSDSGTPQDPSDDGYQFFLYVNPSNPVSTQYRARISNANSLDVIEVDYNQDLLISKFIADGPLTIEISDFLDPNCSTSLTVNPTAPCSTPSGGAPDLELSLTTSNPAPPIYTTTSFTLQVANTGNSPVSGVQVELPAKPNLAYVGHTASQGVFSNWIGFWEVGNLAAGATASLEINLFTLTDQSEKLYAQVIAQNESDADSSPGNGVCCTALEDDEAVVEINGSNPPNNNCSLSIAPPEVFCFDNNTADPSDDTFTFTLNPQGSNLGSSYSLSGGGLSQGGIAYGPTYTSPALAISGGNFSLTISDVSGNCSQQVSIVAPAPCSSAGPAGPDVELSISSSTATISSWAFLTITVMLENTGTESATNLALDFPLPEGVVFTGGNEYSASQGSYSTFFEVWEVGDLPPGGTAMIAFNLFSRQEANPVVAYSQVTQMTENDVDSTPGNGQCCTANEDDEGVITLAPAGGPITREAASGEKLARVAVRQLYPNPATDFIQLVVESPAQQVEQISVYDARGQHLLSRNYPLEEGINFIELSVADLAPGVYLLYVNGAHRLQATRTFLIQH